jgi:hypothetical protein
MLAGLGLAIWSLYLFIEPHSNEAVATLVTGIFCVIVGGGVLWGALRIVK